MRSKRLADFLWTGIAGLSLAITVVALPSAAPAQTPATYPDGITKIIVSFPPGGPLDATARIVADGLQKNLGRTFIVENRAGATGTVGTAAVASAAPDGHTLLAGLDATFTVAPHAYEKLPFDPFKSFEPIARMGAVPLALAVNVAKIPSRDLQSLIAYSQQHQVNFSSAGNGSPGHLALEYLRSKTALKGNHIPYRGNAPASTALLSGEVDAAFIAITGVLPHIQSGALAALAVSGEKRSPLLPNVPTAAEAGVPGFAAVFANVFMAPAGTPAPLIKILDEQVQKILAAPEAKKRLETMGLDPVVGTPDGVRQWIKQENARWGAVVKASGIKLD